MIYKKLSMKDVDQHLPGTQTEAVLYAYLHETNPDIGKGDEQRYPAVVLCPGGAYFFTSDREADPVAFKFLAAGYDVFTLRYSVKPDRYPASLLQLAAVVAHVREHADEYKVDPSRVAVCGFSAGGHLAASVSILWREPVLSETLGKEARMFRPDAAMLCYPVITSGEFAHRYSFECLLGSSADESAVKAMSLEKRVESHVPPMFIWHTWSDDEVPVENSLMLGAALRRARVPFEMHIYPEGRHGLSLGNRLSWTEGNDYQINPHVSSWMGLATSWLDMQFCSNQ